MSEISSAHMLSQLRAMAAAAGGETNGSVNPAVHGGPGQVDFSAMLVKAVDHVNASQQQVSQLREAFQTGQGDVDISEVMIASQKAGVEFQLLLQTRNRMVNAYQEIMSMQI